MSAYKPKHSPSKAHDDELFELRKAAGDKLREMREARGLTQRELGQLLGMPHHTYVSAIEHGRSKVAVNSYGAWAAALGVDLREFVLALMPYYDPITWEILFKDQPWESSDTPEASSDPRKISS